ncbi:hypothetical protein V5799_015063 [Amblyomma americanum]|uniref:Uncharacterized protein n=1 Tax=Amblyomma americanum TaxID=6943 RepID=A0AAQ4E183_AMBAM
MLNLSRCSAYSSEETRTRIYECKARDRLQPKHPRGTLSVLQADKSEVPFMPCWLTSLHADAISCGSSKVTGAVKSWSWGQCCNVADKSLPLLPVSD